MSFFFGGGSGAPQQFNGLATQSSSSNVPIALIWGLNRSPPNVLWQGDFTAHKHKSGGKGGGGKGGTYYTYSASYILSHGWGQMSNVRTVWKDNSKISYSTQPHKLGHFTTGPNFVFFPGTTPQSPWSYMTTKHPTEALGYPGICYSAIANFDLGQSNNLPQLSFELEAWRYNTASWTAGDADISLVVQDFLSDPTIGVGFNMSFLDSASLFSGANAPTTGDNAFQTYCQAMGWGLSPVLNQRTSASEILKRWTDICNTALIWTGYSLKFIPYSAETITGNGVTYAPSFPIRYVITDKDFIAQSGTDPVRFSRTDPQDVKNQATVTIANRDNDYNDLPVRWEDLALVDQYGPKPNDGLTAKEICSQEMAKQVVALIGQRNAYVRNRFSFKLGQNFVLLEPGDIVQIVDKVLGPINVMIEEVNEGEDDLFEFKAFEWNEVVTYSSSVPVQPVAGNNVNSEKPANSINDPIIFEPPSQLQSTPQVWVAASGGPGGVYDANWGGCDVYVSTDNTTFVPVGSVTQPAAMGLLTSSLAAFGGTNPDITHTLAVNLTESNGSLDSASSGADAAAGATLCYVDGELVGPQTATLTGTNAYNLTNLYRGLYGTTPGSHLSGTKFARLDDSIFKYDLPKDYIGRTLYFKFVSFNIWNGGKQDISTVPAYTYTPTGAGYGTGSGGVPAAPSGLTTTSGSTSVTLDWADNPANDNVTGYDIYRAPGTGSAFGAATKIGSAVASVYTDSSASPLTGYTYFVVANNAIGASIHSTGANATTGPATGGTTLWNVTATGTGTSQNITLPYSGVDKRGVFVYVNGVRFPTSEYTITGTTLNMTSNANGDSIEIVGITA